jgi:MDMPI C-terminal domain
VRVFVPRQVRLGRLAPGPQVVELVTSAGVRAVLSPDAARRSAVPTASVTGPAEALLLLLWGRTGLDDPRLHVRGTRRDAEQVLAAPLTP